MANTFLDAKNSAPATDAQSVTASDTVDLPGGVCRSLLVGTAGNLKVTMASGSVVTLPVQAGYNPLQVTRVWTGGTASNIFALY